MPGWLHFPDLIVLAVAEPTLVVAYVVFGMVGFGTTLVSAPILAHVLPLSSVVPALALTDFIASWTNGFRLGAHVDRDLHQVPHQRTIRLELQRLQLPQSG